MGFRRGAAWRAPALLALLGMACAASGCLDDPRPPLRGDDEGTAAATSDAESDPIDKDIALLGGEESSPCSEASVELNVQRPNFYFVLDGSGSMQEEMPGTDGATRHEAAREAVAAMLRRVGARVNYGAATFPRPGSDDACATGVETFSTRRGDGENPDGTDGKELRKLLDRLAQFEPLGATPTAASLEALRGTFSRLGGDTHVFLLTDGAPNCNVAESCDIDRCIPNIEAATFVGGPSCDAELNCCTSDLAPHLCLDDEGTVAVLQELTERGITTYVIGIPGSEIYARVLDDMARAGGAPRGGDTDYFRVADASELADTLLTLGTELTQSCEVALAASPEDRSLVAVLADGEPLALDDPDGWAWRDDRHLELVGDACERWQSGMISQLRAFEGCSVVIY